MPDVHSEYRHRVPSYVFAMTRTVGASTPNCLDDVFPQAEQTDTELSPFSGSVVPS